MKAGNDKAGALKVWFVRLAVSFSLGVASIGFAAAAASAHTETHPTSTHCATAKPSHAAPHVASRLSHHHYASAHRHSHIRYARYSHHHGVRYAGTHYRYSRIQCVPYAREVSHIQLSGNAFLWWAEASGRYARGNTPVEGSVLNFRSIGRMPLGHVAVVTSVIDSRTILVTQANWVHGSITNDVTMQDVSLNNDWTAVQVELGDSKHWGAAYPTYGFIYNQPANNTVIAAAAPADEVAEAPRAAPIASEAPNRNLQ